MPHSREREFIVEGRMPFPLDMLRYDSCFPVDTASAHAIAQSLDNNHVLPKNEVYRVKLMSRSFQAPTEGRWSSFMWRVV